MYMYNYMTVYRSQAYLCCCEENFLWNVTNSTGDCSQRYPRENVGIVSLTRVQSFPIVNNGIKRTSTGKNTSTLKQKAKSDTF